MATNNHSSEHIQVKDDGQKDGMSNEEIESKLRGTYRMFALSL
jgi:hypothetical protein